MYVSEALTLDVQRIRSPDTGTDKYSAVSVAEHIIDRNCNSDRSIRAYLYSESKKVFLIPFYKQLRKSEFWDTVTQYTAYLFARLEYRYVIAASRKNYRDSDTRGTASDDSDTLTLFFDRSSCRLYNAQYC